MRYCKEYFDDVRLVADTMPDITALLNKTICITGSTGMLCSAVVDIIALLNEEKDAHIKLILAGRNKEKTDARFEGLFKKNGYEFALYDATKEGVRLPVADYYIHGASNADPAKMASEPVETMLSNILGLKTVLDSAACAKGSRVLFISSGEIYGNPIVLEDQRSEKQHEDLSEEYGGFTAENALKENDYGYIDVLNPRACYPMSKRAAETMCAAFYQEHGVDYVIARSCHAYGPGIAKGDSRATAAFTRNAALGKDIVMKSAGEQIRSYCYTLDSAAALLTILLHGNSCEAYNISNENSVVAIRDIAEEIAAAAGVRVVFENPDDVEKKSYNMMKASVLDCSKLKELGWRAKFDLKSGVNRTLKFFK
ncbi:Nucleoside-diphosphate-sugar epimerase [Butyrivibrio proteoclasticus]|uniref:Nucleoside-diphosphate-sugar epimerase n=2 Tax=Butyrivibrio proteoclasticus TaxID=43305 RepID=A0A1I5TG04_9FIRM|nr:Nucleoside-diphosphate-sugar epimerase [Butyrivibrio proteoclasticus]